MQTDLFQSIISLVSVEDYPPVDGEYYLVKSVIEIGTPYGFVIARWRAAQKDWFNSKASFCQSDKDSKMYLRTPLKNIK